MFDAAISMMQHSVTMSSFPVASITAISDDFMPLSTGHGICMGTLSAHTVSVAALPFPGL